MNIILASGSPRRKHLLQRINVDFEVQVSNAGEEFDSRQPPAHIAQQLALRKAEQVASINRGQNIFVIGADTIVVHEGTILEKPATADEAHQMLRQLSGTTHQVLTGVAFVKRDIPHNNSKTHTFVETTEVTFGELDETEIREYVETGSPMDKAGGYGIQDGRGALFVKKISGDYYNVVGFPLHSFYQNLKQFAPELLPASINHST